MEFRLKNRKTLVETVVYVVLPLVIGIAIYWLARPRAINIFNWFKAVYPSVLINKPYLSVSNIPDWLLYNSPDFLWIFSFTSLLLIIWNKKITRKNTFYLLIPCIFAILHEFGQLFSLVDGTFDKVDLLFYLLGYFSSILLLKNSKKQKTNHEKNIETSY